VKIVWPFRIRGHSTLMGSFTLMIISAAAHTSSAVGRICAPTAVYCASSKPAAEAGALLHIHLWPAATSASAPAGTRAMRFSLVLISFGMPIFIKAVEL
jgi:hypothetical protein